MTHGVAFELDPGQAVCPYHYEYGHELWTVVLEGRPSIRTPEGLQQLDVGDIVFVPRGPEGAHQLVNASEDRALLLGFSNAGLGATAYPDSGKIGVWTDVPGEDFIAERSSAVGYYHRETALETPAAGLD